MIKSLRGNIIAHYDRSIVIEVMGVGYEVFITPFFKKTDNETVFVFTSHIVREDSSHLYGFETKLDRDFFNTLLTVSGIGPKSALSILSLATPDDITQAVIKGNADYLTKISGIGKKTAQKIVLELKDKVTGEHKEHIHSDVFQALTALGYTHESIREVIILIDTTLSIQDQMKEALKLLSSTRT